MEWSVAEQESHTKILELKACQHSLHSFCKNVKKIHVRIIFENMTSCSYTNKLGRKTEELDSISREILFWWIDKHIHLSAANVPGKDNQEADQESRSENDDTEWYWK